MPTLSENYRPDAILSGAVPRLVTLRPPDWTLDEPELRAAFSDRTRAVIVNAPNNPTGKVLSREELEAIAALCLRPDVATARHPLVEHVGVASVPGSSVFSDPAEGSHLLRFAFGKELATLEAAGERLVGLRRG